ncbi:MAG: DNA-formamidopyrimidine glycosylase [Candidatus Aminicenantes bacterium]|nr:DNA-formamidopyrimidine glycosylase [Candidatus Aminicenantes bacterium]
MGYNILMPELPEAETICRSLKPEIKGRVITGIKLLWPPLLRETQASALDHWLGARLIDIRRRGKMILLDIDDQETMLIHLKMTGQLFLVSVKEPVDKHTRLILRLDEGQWELRFRDPRKFGYIKIFKTFEESQTPPLNELGPEPLTLSASDFVNLFRKFKGKIKSLLLRQNFIAGLGNIYTDEILHQAKINPERLSNSLSNQELIRLYWAMIKILNRAIEYRGTSVRDYRDGRREAGDFQNHLRVYGREGERCFRCHGLILRKKIGGRSAFFCPQCQPALV